MEGSQECRDLVLLVADKNIEYTVRGLFSRPEALTIRQITFEVIPHPERDPGCLLRAPEFLRAFESKYRHAIVLFDLDGCGREQETRESLESDLEDRLASAWKDRAAAVVLEPELEAWFWSDSPHVEEILGWRGREPALRTWLKEEGLQVRGAAKPQKPKEAVEDALRIAQKPRSSALYRKLAAKVSFKSCTDPSFRKFLGTLRNWFPAT